MRSNGIAARSATRRTASASPSKRHSTTSSSRMQDRAEVLDALTGARRVLSGRARAPVERTQVELRHTRPEALGDEGALAHRARSGRHATEATARPRGDKSGEPLRNRLRLPRVERSRELCARLDPELAVDATEVRLDRLAADERLRGDRVVREARRGQTRDAELGGRQVGRRRARRGPRELLPRALAPWLARPARRTARRRVRATRAPAASA